MKLRNQLLRSHGFRPRSWSQDMSLGSRNWSLRRRENASGLVHVPAEQTVSERNYGVNDHLSYRTSMIGRWCCIVPGLVSATTREAAG